MENTFIHETAKILNSQYGRIKLFRNVSVINSKFGDDVSIGDDTTIERCEFENNITINRRSYINDSFIGKYSYTGINTIMNWTKMGRFCSIARNVDIGGFNHDYKKVTTMPAFRFKQIMAGGGKIPAIVQHKDYCIIGNDVWIAAGAQILHNVKIGDGAVVGGGAVVTHDVPDYAIVAGVPAKVIGYRCDEKFIEDLLEIKWWEWPDGILVENAPWLIESDINEKTISKMKKISKKLGGNNK